MTLQHPEPESDDSILDIVGVGFGPSNLALAISVQEHNATVPPNEHLTMRFLERKPAFGWHLGMLLEGTTMQVSFLKDLATMRNPRSQFTFLTYLHERSRLVDFINHKILYPSRIEFHDYLEWAAAQFDNLVTYQTDVADVQLVREGQNVECLDVIGSSVVQPYEKVTLRTRNIVIGTGLVPVVPPEATTSPRVSHSSELLDRLATETWARASRFAVIGAGQSGAEVLSYLHTAFPQAQVHAIFSRYGYSPADDSPFVNQVFDPAGVDEFFQAPEHAKDALYRYHANTNYSVVDPDLINELYRRVYSERVLGRRRLHIHRLCKASSIVEKSDHVAVRFERLNDGRTRDLEVDAVVLATGYSPMDPSTVLGEGTGELCLRNASGRLRVERDYSVDTPENVRCGIFLQGGTEHTHGISGSLLSLAAVRAGEIVSAICRRERSRVRV